MQNKTRVSGFYFVCYPHIYAPSRFPGIYISRFILPGERKE